MNASTSTTTSFDEADLLHQEDCPVYFDDFEPLIKQGSLDGRCYVILEGSVEIKRNGRMLSMEGPGSIVGEMSLIDNGPATADVIATRPTVAIAISRNRFEELVQEHPDFAIVVMKVITSRLRRTEKLN
ncbi:MAG: cyclic nucleotide-binding protein [Verrucomicrobiales bacterium]|nr:cyclic nucleotide-binding protein [Verrucomicrobiales bacterium]